MTLSDPGLSNFSLGLVTAAGAILAVSATVWIFVFDRRSRDEVEALGRVRANATALYNFMASNVNSPGNYLKYLDSYYSFARTIAEVSLPHSVESVPDYISWRRNTSAVAQKSLAFAQELQTATQQTLSGKQPSLRDSLTLEFHTQFVGLMDSVDLAIQELDWATGVRKIGRTSIKFTLGVTIAVLLGSLIVGLATLVETSAGFNDNLNVFVAILLVVGVIAMCSFLVWAFYVNSVSREEWIRKRERQARKKYGVTLSTTS